jgi:serine/threonine-protein kinase
MPLFGELRRRNIFKVSLAYAIVSWLIVQVADIVLPVFHAPPWVMQILVLLLILIFPIAVLLAWAYELTPEGFKPSSDVDKTQSITVRTGQKLNHAVVVLLATAVIFLVVDNYLLKGPEAPPPSDTSYRKSIAVLPFENGSAAEENAQFLADGLHDELLTRLSKISDLRVISRTSVMGYRGTTRNLRDIGEALGVGSILEGGLQRSGDDVRINVQLIDSQTDEHLWAETFDAELTAASVFAVQSEISTAIAEALEAQLSPTEQERLAAVPTENTAALQAYFSGKQLVETRTTSALLESIEFFERAVSLDPEFASAWAGIAEAWLELPNYSPDIDHGKVRREAASAAIRAATVDPDSAQALAVLGWHLLLHNYDWDGAEDALRKSLQIETNNVTALHWYSHLLSWQGKRDDAIVAARLAVKTDPLSQLIKTNLNYILLDAGMWTEADAVAAEVLQVAPYASLLGNVWIGHLRAGDAEQAATVLLQWATATNRDVEAATALGELIIRAVAMGEEVDLEQTLIDSLQIKGQLPEVYATLRDAENTILSLKDVVATGTGFRSLLSMKINPSYDFIRDDPRFQVLLDEVGLAD